MKPIIICLNNNEGTLSFEELKKYILDAYKQGYEEGYEQGIKDNVLSTYPSSIVGTIDKGQTTLRGYFNE